MQFTPDNAAKVMAGTKTQTRRIVKEGERLLSGHKYLPDEVLTCSGGFEHLKWQVGHTYAVQPGRGKPAIGRVRLLSIRKEKLQDIKSGDAIDEGVEYIEWLWAGMGDGIGLGPRKFVLAYKRLWDSINKHKGTRWADNPDVWALTFEVVP